MAKAEICSRCPVQHSITSQKTAKKAPIQAEPKTLCSTLQTHSRSGVYSVYQVCIAFLRKKSQLSL